MSRLIPLMWVVVAISAPLAHAQKPRVVLVPLVPGDGANETAASKFNALLTDELKSRPEVMELVAPPATKAAAPTPDKGATGKRTPSPEAVGALDAGKKAFDDLRFEDATASLRKGIDGMLADPATADYEGVTDGYVKLAASAFRMGEEKAAKEALLELARFAPAYELPAGFPPVFQREFDKAKKRLDKQPKGSVSIEGPPGSTAFIDGRDLGMVPVLEENIPGGTHYVMVEGTKGERFGQTVTLTGGVVKVKGAFGGGSAGDKRSVVGGNAAVVAPGVTAIVDEGVQGRLGPYMKAVNADYAIVGYVYKTSDTQLTAGTAIFSAKKSAFTSLNAVSFDTDVLTANTEAYKLGAEIVQRLSVFGTSASLPLNLASRSAKAGTSTATAKNVDTPTNPEEIAVAGPRKKVVLVPRPEKTTVVAIEEPPVDLGERPPEEIKADNKPLVWPWVVVGVLVVGGLAVGGTVIGLEVAKPVTGTVTATW